MFSTVTKSDNDKAKSIIERARFVNLCEPANFVFPASFVKELRDGGVYASNITTATPWSGLAEHVVKYYEHYKLIRENSDIVGMVDKFSDLEENHRAGKTSFILGLQGLDFIGTEIGYLEVFRKLGLLVTTIAYNRRNAIGDGCNEPANSGLSMFGREVIGEMNRLGIVVDFAHVGEKTSIEAAELSKDPVIDSHGNCKAVTPHPRNISDELVHAIAETKGVIGAVASPNFIRSDKQPTIKDYVAHIKHVSDVAGIDTAGIGLDQYPWKKLDREKEFFDAIYGKFPETSKGPKFERPFDDALDWPKIVEVMVSEGFSDGEIKKVVGENAIRVFERVWK